MSIIQVDHVTKEYKLGQIQSLKTTALNQWRRLTGQPVEERAPFKALDDVTFSVEQGEVLGIIGHNGAGKSTMLKLLANIAKPSRGSITVKGKVAPLIEVGAGLVGELTGRENIYLNGAILGIPKSEISSKLDDIVAFAELEEFIDTPIKRYSSGMSVRLGFAIATSVESDILIVDEVLAVGDLAFQRKCFDRMESLIKQQGKTVLLVSHNIRQVERLCSRVLILDHGRIIGDGEPRQICNRFYELSDQRIKEQHTHGKDVSHSRKYETSGELELDGITLLDIDGRATESIRPHQDMTVKLSLNVKIPLENVLLAVGVHTTDFIYLTTGLSDDDLPGLSLSVGRHEILCSIKRFPLNAGVYAIRVGIAASASQSMVFYGDNLLNFQVVSDRQQRSLTASEGFFSIETSWSQREAQ